MNFELHQVYESLISVELILNIIGVVVPMVVLETLLCLFFDLFFSSYSVLLLTVNVVMSSTLLVVISFVASFCKVIQIQDLDRLSKQN